MAKISFVMPTRNRGEIINETIKTIVTQDEKDWELIVVDNGSDANDKTQEVVNSFSDDRIRFYKMPANFVGGIAEARNYGAMFATSKIIAPTDSDDIYLPNRARLIVDTFEKKNWDVFYADYDYYYKETDEFKPRINPIQDFDLELLKKFNFIPHPTSAYRRELAYQFPYNPFFKVAEDYDFFSRLALANKKFYFCQEKVMHYVIHKSNVSGGKGLLPLYDKIIHLNRGWKSYDRAGVLKEILKNYGK